MAKSRVEQALAAVEPEVLALFPGVTFAFGETNVAQNASPPRVVWLRAEDGTSAQQARTTAREIPAQLDRYVALVAVCWARRGGSYETDDAAIEALVDAVEIALKTCVGTALVLPLAEQWTVEGWTQTGKSARVAFVLRMPVAEPAPTIVGTEDVPVDVGFDDTGKSDTDGILQAKDG